MAIRSKLRVDRGAKLREERFDDGARVLREKDQGLDEQEERGERDEDESPMQEDSSLKEGNGRKSRNKSALLSSSG